MGTTPILMRSKTITHRQLSMLLLLGPLLPIWTPRWVPPIQIPMEAHPIRTLTPMVAPPQAPLTPSQARRKSQLHCPQWGHLPHHQRKHRCVSLQRIRRPCRIHLDETQLACIVTLGSSTGYLQMMEIGSNNWMLQPVLCRICIIWWLHLSWKSSCVTRSYCQ